MCYAYNYPQQTTNYNYQNYGTYNSGYYNNNYYRGSFPFASYNRGIDPYTNAPAYGNIGVGNGLAAFYLLCHNCGRTG